MSSPFPPDGVMCHRAGFAVSCMDGVAKHKCQLWVSLKGADPQTNAIVDKYGCADAWAPILQIEATQATRQLDATVQAMRNEAATAQVDSRQAAERVLRSITGFGAGTPNLIEQG